MRSISIKAKLISGAIGAILLGAGATVAVFASIPSIHGVINGCRSDTSGQISVIGSSASCEAGQTSLKWDRGLLGYAYQPDVDTSDFTMPFTKGSMALTVTKVEENGNYSLCVDLPGDIASAARFATVNGAVGDLLLRGKEITSTDLDAACGQSYEGLLGSQALSPSSIILVY